MECCNLESLVLSDCANISDAGLELLAGSYAVQSGRYIIAFNFGCLRLWTPAKNAASLHEL